MIHLAQYLLTYFGCNLKIMHRPVGFVSWVRVGDVSHIGCEWLILWLPKLLDAFVKLKAVKELVYISVRGVAQFAGHKEMHSPTKI